MFISRHSPVSGLTDTLAQRLCARGWNVEEEVSQANFPTHDEPVLEDPVLFPIRGSRSSAWVRNVISHKGLRPGGVGELLVFADQRYALGSPWVVALGQAWEPPSRIEHVACICALDRVPTVSATCCQDRWHESFLFLCFRMTPDELLARGVAEGRRRRARVPV